MSHVIFLYNVRELVGGGYVINVINGGTPSSLDNFLQFEDDKKNFKKIVLGLSFCSLFYLVGML